MDKVPIAKKKLLIYAHYYMPDTASTAQLLCDMAEGLSDQFDVTVICVVPSYTGTIAAGYKVQKFYRERQNGVEILRIRVPEFTKSDKKSRIMNILAYFFGAMRATFMVGMMDYVLSVSQPPILGGLLGVWGKWIKRANYIYAIQDFNPEQTMAVAYSKNAMLLKLLMWLDKFSCKRADKVIVVGRDMVQTLKARFRGSEMPEYGFINNWIDEQQIHPLPQADEKVQAFKRKYGLEDCFVIMYSGNIGLYYDLERIMRLIEELPRDLRTPDGKRVAFVFVGAGGLLDVLRQYCDAHNMDTVTFIPYQAKEDLNYSLNAGDVHWCINAKGIKGVSVPSKCYGIMAAGKPVLGVLEANSEARLLIENSDCGICCEPGDYRAIAHQINWFVGQAGALRALEMGRNGRAYLEGHLTKSASIKKYAEALSSLEGKNGS